MGRQRRRNFSVGMKKSALYAVRSVDIVADTASLARYKLVVVPALNVLTPEAAGHLVLGQRSAMKDEDYSLWPQRQPRPLTALLGARVKQFYALDRTVPVTGNLGTGKDAIWAEQLEVQATDARIVMHYGASNGWLDQQPAAVTRSVGKGSIPTRWNTFCMAARQRRSPCRGGALPLYNPLSPDKGDFVMAR